MDGGTSPGFSTQSSSEESGTNFIQIFDFDWGTDAFVYSSEYILVVTFHSELQVCSPYAFFFHRQK